METQALLAMVGGQLVIECPVFLALIVGAVIGAVAFVRNNKLAGTLAFCGFAALVVLLFLRLLSSALPTLLYRPGITGQELSTMGLALSGAACVLNIFEAVGMLLVIGALAAYAFQKRNP